MKVVSPGGGKSHILLGWTGARYGGADTVDKVELSSSPTRNALSQNIFRLFFVSVPVDRVWIEFSATNFVNRGSPTVLLVLHLVSTYRTCKTA